jgi:hypothetical protein
LCLSFEPRAYSEEQEGDAGGLKEHTIQLVTHHNKTKLDTNIHQQLGWLKKRWRNSCLSL